MGIVIGVEIGLQLASWSERAYKRLLVMKAEDGTAEYIDGEFYYIKKEGK